MDLLKFLALPGAVLAYLGIKKYYKDNTKYEKQKLIDKSIHSVSPEQIINELKSNGNKVKYEGYKVKWHVVFDKFETSIFGGGELFLKIGDVILRTKATLNEYPQLKNEEKDKKYIITGLILKVEKKIIYLKLIELEIDNFFVF